MLFEMPMGEPRFNYFNYFTDIEDHFISRRGKHILLSPLDWTLIETWQSMGIPLHVALRGIDRAMATFREKQIRHRLVNSLFYCNQSVLEEFEHHLLSQEGRAADEMEPVRDAGSATLISDLPGFLKARQVEMQRLADRFPGTPAAECGTRMARRLDEIIDAIRLSARPDPERVECDLRAIDDAVAPALADTLPPPDRKALIGECRRELRHHRASLPPDMYQRILDSLVRRRIRERFGLSELTLLDSR